jgi:hypothetical protein
MEYYPYDTPEQYYEPGSHGGYIRGYIATPSPTSTSDYDRVFLPVVRIAGDGVARILGSHMIITDAVQDSNGYGYTLTLTDERVVLDGCTLDMAAQQGNTFGTIAQNAFLAAGFPSSALTDLGDYYPGTMTGLTDKLTARQTWTHLLQASGCITRARQGVFRSLPLKQVTVDSDGDPTPMWTISPNWVKSVTNLSNTSVYVTPIVYYYNEPGARRKDAHLCCIKGNPFIISGNWQAIQTIVRSRMGDGSTMQFHNSGLEVECLFNPLLEPGDFIQFGASVNVLSRIEWNGGAFCRLYFTRGNTDYQ